MNIKRLEIINTIHTAGIVIGSIPFTEVTKTLNLSQSTRLRSKLFSLGLAESRILGTVYPSNTPKFNAYSNRGE